MADEKGITGLDIRFLVRELRQRLRNAVFRKIVQYGKKQFLFELFVPAKGTAWLFVDQRTLFLTEYKKAAPAEPPMFCMFLRKHLLGKRIHDITQYEFDRIVEIETEDAFLVIELFHPGNVILCDKIKNILLPVEVQRWKDREIRPRIAYKYPPKAVNPLALDIGELMNICQQSEKKLIVLLASPLGFGALYAAEICRRAGIDGQTEARRLDLAQATAVLHAIESLLQGSPGSRLYDDAVSPFPLQIYEGKPSAEKPTFSEALDDFFSARRAAEEQGAAGKEREAQEQKQERIARQQEEAQKKWARIEQDSREAGDLISAFYDVVDGVLSGIRQAKNAGLSWTDIRERIRTEHSPEAEAIVEIRERDRTVVVELGGRRLELDFTKSAGENAAHYYDEAKWARQKQGRVAVAKEEQARQPRPEAKPHPLLQKRTRKKWFEQFKWFRTSDGFLVVAGRDAATNEALIKKHTEPQDTVFHADIAGAAFAVLKTEGRSVTTEALKEAAEFAAANSRAWSRGLGTVDVYGVRPDQVSKTPPAGQTLAKGAFMIHGEREWFRDMNIQLAVGVTIDREHHTAQTIAGPLSAIRKQADYAVVIQPGAMSAAELAGLMHKKLMAQAKQTDRPLIASLPPEELRKAIPAGRGDLKTTD